VALWSGIVLSGIVLSGIVLSDINDKFHHAQRHCA
jgi:hypothetical protein